MFVCVCVFIKTKCSCYLCKCKGVAVVSSSAVLRRPDAGLGLPGANRSAGSKDMGHAACSFAIYGDCVVVKLKQEGRVRNADASRAIGIKQW